MNNNHANNDSAQSEARDRHLSERIRIAHIVMRLSQQQELDRIRLVQQEQSQLQVERLQRVQHAARLALQRSQERELQQLRRQILEDNDEELRRYEEAFANELEIHHEDLSSLNGVINDLEERLGESAQGMEDYESESSEEGETDEDDSEEEEEEEEREINDLQQILGELAAGMDQDEADSQWETDSDTMDSDFDEDESDDLLDFRFDGEESAAEVRERINELRKENEECASKCLRFSRACGICYSASPLQRAVFSSCGHALCLACAEQHRANPPIDGERGLDCPFCRCQGGFVKLFEDLIEEEAVTNDN